MFKPASKVQLQRAARLDDAHARTRFGQTRVEGVQAVRELLRFAPDRVRDVYLTEQASARDAELVDAAGNFFAHHISEAEANTVAPAAQGVFAVVDVPREPPLGGVLDGATFVLATLDIQNPGNLGTIIRAADASGADAVLVGRGSADVTSPKVIRSAAGSTFHLPVVSGVRAAQLEEELHRAGIAVLAADGRGEWDLSTLVAESYRRDLLGVRSGAPDLAAPHAWVLGNEARGFEGATIRPDTSVSIPLRGEAESLNVAVAAGVLAMTTAMVRESTGRK